MPGHQPGSPGREQPGRGSEKRAAEKVRWHSHAAVYLHTPQHALPHIRLAPQCAQACRCTLMPAVCPAPAQRCMQPHHPPRTPGLGGRGLLKKKASTLLLSGLAGRYLCQSVCLCLPHRLLSAARPPWHLCQLSRCLLQDGLPASPPLSLSLARALVLAPCCLLAFWQQQPRRSADGMCPFLSPSQATLLPSLFLAVPPEPRARASSQRNWQRLRRSGEPLSS